LSHAEYCRRQDIPVWKMAWWRTCQRRRTAAVLYSLIASAKRHGLDPFAYLRDVLGRISDHSSHKLHELLPDHWKLTHAAPVHAPA
jgi:hypothetical protein